MRGAYSAARLLRTACWNQKLSFSRFNEAFTNGAKSMVSSVMILVLSWSFSELLGSSMLRTGGCIAKVLGGWLPGWALPAAIFVISALISFSTGSSWGAMGIMLPTAIAVCAAVDASYMYMVLGAGLSGCVFGDHCSPVGGYHCAFLCWRRVQTPCPCHDAAAIRGYSRRDFDCGVYRCWAYRQCGNFISGRISGDNYPVLYYWKEE